ncbi:MAG: DUF2911 domain-containing protein [Gemmatimonadota bacterium]
MRPIPVYVLAAALAVVATSCAPAADTGLERTFVQMLGADTISIERFTVTGDRIEGTWIVRTPLTRVHSYTAELDGEGGIRRLTGTLSTPATNAGAGSARSYEYTARGDSADVVVVTGSDTTRSAISLPPGATPIPPNIPAPPSILELVTKRLADADELPLSFINPLASRPTGSGLVRRGGDTVAVLYFGNPILVVRSADGVLERVTGRETTVKLESDAASTALDLEALAADFGARDAAGEGLGVPSPADTTRAAVAGSELEVAYSQPAMRGREIWGALVPYDVTWRTGANSATMFWTTADVQIGGATIPAGEYTLWSTYTSDSAELIINSQTGQWGTVYDEAQDFVRVPMEWETSAEPFERFTIGIEGDESGGRMTFSWADRTYFVPMASG